MKCRYCKGTRTATTRSQHPRGQGHTVPCSHCSRARNWPAVAHAMTLRQRMITAGIITPGVGPAEDTDEDTDLEHRAHMIRAAIITPAAQRRADAKRP